MNLHHDLVSSSPIKGIVSCISVVYQNLSIMQSPPPVTVQEDGDRTATAFRTAIGDPTDWFASPTKSAFLNHRGLRLLTEIDAFVDHQAVALEQGWVQ